MSVLIPKLDKLNRVFEQFDNLYDVHFCNLNEIGDLTAFIDSYWKKGHILATSRELMDWQHLDSVNGRYNFVLAREKNTNGIHAILGFIPTSIFDIEIEQCFIWGAIWKVRDDVAPMGLGVYLFQFATTELNPDCWIGFGLSEDAVKNNKSMGFTLSVCDNYFFVNPKMRHFEIGVGLEKYQGREYHNISNFSLMEISETDYQKKFDSDDIFSFVKPYKTKSYFLNRYFKHPLYKYRCFAIIENTINRALFFVRECAAKQGKCLRLVEFIGKYDYLKNVKKSVQDVLYDENFEYIDIITSNVPDEIFENAGFINKKTDRDVVIPNYFEPFLQENIEMQYSYISRSKDFKYIINKGDSDQDRPNSFDFL